MTIKFLHKTFFAYLFVLLFAGGMHSQNVLVSGALVGNGTYSDLGSAFTAVNGGAQTGANIVVAITGNTAETSTATLNTGAWSSLTISPAGGATRVISGNIAGPLINFNGASRILVDGLNTGGNGLNIDNTNNTSASTIHFINDARLIAIKKTAIFGGNTSITSGTVFFSTGTVSGNDSIGFDACIIGASGANFPVNGVASIGSVTAGLENSGITFNACNIENFFSAGAISNGILADVGNSDWTINSCKFFQTGTRTYTTANTHKAIRIASGSNHTITNNTIGFASAAGTGVYTMAGTIATRFIGIDLAVGTTTASSVQGNSISSISLATSSGATTTNGVLCGINVTSGSVNIGNLTGNTIGATSGINSLTVTSTTSGAIIMGINTSSNGAMTIQNNSIGALASSGIVASIAGSITGINVSGIASSLLINGNTIGNSTADNIRGGTSGLTTGSSIVHGINAPSTATNPTISNNTIQNLAAYGTGTTGAVRGINTAAASGNANIYTIQNNIIRNLITNAANTSISNGQAGVAGIVVSTGTNGIVRGNTIHSLSNTGTGTNQSFVAGIGHGNATNTAISGNIIYNLSNAGTSITATAPSVIAGVIVRSGTTALTITNNMIALGTAQTTNSVIIGIQTNNGSTPDPVSNIYHNTINIEGTVSAGAQPTFGIARTDFSATARTAGVDIRNNIITNSRSGGTGSHYAIGNNYGAVASVATGWASNNNVLNANTATIGFWTSAQTFSGWKISAASDANSFSGITVTYVNPANDLHLNMGLTPTVIESNGQSIASITTDFDGQNRPGPTGSLNGGAFAPDLGADEIDAVYLDVVAPVITYAPLTFICTTGDRTLTATIIDGSGVPTSGVLQPRIYFRKNAGAWFSTQGILASGTANNGTWSFTISATAMGGLSLNDNISYYVVAQDVIPNIGSNPSTGLVAANVNTVTIAPTTPNIYSISGTMIANYDIGAAGNFPTLTAAANAYNNSCLTGAVTFTLQDPTYPSEVFPIVFNANADASAVNNLIIRPAIGNNPFISGSSATAIIQINGGDYITINGNNNGGVNSICPLNRSTRNLKIENTNTATASAVVSINNTASGNAATNIKVMNTIVSGNAPLTTGVAINVSGPTIGSGTGAVNNSNISIVNDSIIKAQVGIFSSSLSLANKNKYHNYDLNVMTASGTDAIGRFGIMALFADSINIRSNQIKNILNTASQDVVAISLGLNAISNSVTTGAEASNAIVTGNDIDNIVQTNTFSAGGIAIASAASGTNLVANNIINGVFANGTSGDFAVGILSGGGAGTLNIYHNTVNVSGPALTGASQPNMALGINGTTPNVNIKNNILLCNGSNGFDGNTGIGLGYTSTIGAYANLNSSNNDIFVSGTNSAIGRTGGLATGTVRTTLLDWQTETGADLNSVSINPTTISASNLRLVAGSNAGIENAGAPLAAVTTDIDCESRTNTPDMGADEVCVAPTLATISVSATSICAGDSVTLSVSSGSLNDATNWKWYSGSCGGTLVGTGVSIKLAPNDTADYFVRAEGGCAPVGACTSINIIVKPLPTIGGVPISVGACSGQTLTLNATGNAASYSWNNGVANNVAFIPTLTGFYTVTGTSANGCVKKDSVSVLVNTSPVVTASSSTSSVCAGLSVTLNGGGAATYTWNNGVTNGVSFIPNATNTYVVTGTAANGCTDTASITVTVNANPIVNLGGNQSTCNASLVLNAGNPGSTYVWSNAATSQTITVTTSGNYKVTVSNAVGCSKSDSAVITLNSALIANLTPNVSSVCEGTSAITLVGTPAGGTFSSNAIGGSFNPTTAGTFTASYIVSNVCGADTADATITVNANPVASLSAPVSVLCTGTPATLTGLPAGGTYSVVSGSAGALTGNVFNANTTGNYTIAYTFTNAATCSDSAQFNFNVNCILGLDKSIINNSSFTILPNPNNGVFTINSAIEIDGTIELINELGQVVYKNRMNGLSQQLNVQNLSAGIYHVKVSNGSSLQTQRISIFK
jgi:trimeric autotransporter adhesin